MIRAAVPVDAGAVAALEAVALGDDAWSPALVAQGTRGDVPTLRYLVCHEGDALVGYAAVSLVADVAELQRIAVDPGHRRSGVATGLLAAVVDLARTAGLDRLLLEVREDNAGALAFYVDRGFVEIDRRRRYYRDGAAAVVMRLPLGAVGDGSA